MVEQDAIYEEIKTRRYASEEDFYTSSNVPNGDSPMDEEEEEEEETTFTCNSIYEDMNGLGDELAETYNIQNVHSRQGSDNLLMDFDEKPTTNGIYATHYSLHNRNSSSSSSEAATVEYQPKRNCNRMLSRSAEELVRSHPLQDYDRETIYSEIVTNSDSTEVTTGRATRESNNPILRQTRMSSSFKEQKRAVSMHDIHINGLYGCIDHVNSNSKHSSTKTVSLDRNRGAPTCEVYENHSLLSSQGSIQEVEDVYENSRPPAKHETLLEGNHLSRQQELCVKCNQIRATETCVTKNLRQESFKRQQNRDLARSTESVASLYENIGDPDEFIYEKVSDHEMEFSRERSSSKPINIAPHQTLSRHTSYDEENEYSLHKKSVAPFSISSMSSSVTSSPRGSICSSISSELSSAQTRSMSPPPPALLSKKRSAATSSWSDMSAFQGLNYFPANYLGKHYVSKLTRDSVDEAVRYRAERTNLLEMRPVHTEVSHDLIRIGSNASPWELIESFAIEDVINIEVITKNVLFIGIIAGKPGEEAVCYVLQSEKSTEIAEAIGKVFQTVSNRKLPISRTSYEVSIQPEFHRFHFLVKVGSTKVRRSFRCVNEYIKLVLEKVNPKDFRHINLEVLGTNVVITDSHYEEEISHSTPSILSLGVYSGDKRYFGYIITEVSTPNKQRVQCHVYRAARNSTAANIIDAISTSYQSAYSPRNSETCEVNPIYAPTYGTRPNNNKPQDSPISPINPIYSKFYGTSNTRTGGVDGRNSIVSMSSTTSVGSLNFSLNSSPDCSPMTTLQRKEKSQSGNSSSSMSLRKDKSNYGSSSLIDRLTNLRSGVNNNRLSVNVECLSEEQKNLLIDFEEAGNNSPDKNLLVDVGSTETLLTLTPSSPSGSLPRSSPVTKRERPKSLPLLDLDAPFESSKEFMEKDEGIKREGEQRKSKHKKLFNKLRGSIKEKLTTPSNTQINAPNTPIEVNNSINNFHFVEKPIMLDENIIPSTHTFKITYICSTLVKPPLRPKHVREAYKQFTKEMYKAEKVSNNNGLRTIGSQVNMVIVTDTEVMMQDPADPTNIIRQCSIDLFEQCMMHPDDTMGCFAFSTSVPGNAHKHKIHLFTMPNQLRNDVTHAFQQFEANKRELLALGSTRDLNLI